MYLLIQVILHLNQSLPSVNVVSKFEALDICENKLEKISHRFKNPEHLSFLGSDEENNKFLKLTQKNNGLISYWTCKDIIFFNNS